MMRGVVWIARALVALAVWAGTPLALEAQTFNPVIGGVPVSCTAFTGQPVITIANPLLPDVGRARPGMPPTIELNPRVLSILPGPLQLFWYGHECAHHALAHTHAFNLANEAAADCWSIKTMRNQGLLTGEMVAAFGPWFANNPGSFWGHLPGPARAANFMGCFQAP